MRKKSHEVEDLKNKIQSNSLMESAEKHTSCRSSTSTIKLLCQERDQVESILPSSTVTFPLKKYFPCPLERATPKLCREIKRTLKSVTQ